MLSKHGTDYEGALALFDRVLELNPHNEKAWIAKAVAMYVYGEDDEKALRCFDRALAVNPKSIILLCAKARILPTGALAKVFLGKGMSLRKELRRHVNEALECYDRALRISPRSGEAYDGKGGTLESWGDFRNAVKTYKRALSLPLDGREAEVRERLRIVEEKLEANASDAFVDTLRRIRTGDKRTERVLNPFLRAVLKTIVVLVALSLFGMLAPWEPSVEAFFKIVVPLIVASWVAFKLINHFLP